MKPQRIRAMIIVTAITGILCGSTAGLLLSLVRDLPQIQTLESFQPSAITRIVSSDQVVLSELYIEKRDVVSLDLIPEQLKIALLTTEDRQFYHHSGLAIRGILRAIVQNIRQGRYAQGASTLTQQLAKTLFLTPRKTISRKLREALLAIQLERRYTKDEILWLYLNQIYLGSGAYGVASAANVYFGKKVQDLTLAQCALIAGLPKAPTRYSPFNNPELALKRRNLVLDQMLATGAIDTQKHRQAALEELTLTKSLGNQTTAPFFVAHVKEQLEEAIGSDQLYKGGLTIFTTLSDELQQAAELAVQIGLTQLEDRMMSRRMSSVNPQSALVAIDIGTGGILAMVGGRDDTTTRYNRATMAERQPGSAFKPIVYALAVERGFEQTSTLLDAPVIFQSSIEAQDWRPENFSENYSGEITLRWSLVHSKNIPAVRLMEKIGPSSVVQFGQALGLRTKLKPDLSLALGTSEVRLMDLTAAYAVFANRGRYTAPYGVTEVRNAANQTIWRAKTEQHIAMRRSSAAIITDMLQAVITSGTARKARILPGPLAGKTGTTNDFKDALFVGYSPNLCAGVWVGNDDASSLGDGETGARAALPIWILFMKEALNRQVYNYFDLPDDCLRVSIDPRSGRPVGENTAEAERVLVKRPEDW
jgi:penicillin-binding protein 1A